MKETSINVIQNDVYSKGLQLAKIKYLTFFLKEKRELLSTKDEKRNGKYLGGILKRLLRFI